VTVAREHAASRRQAGLAERAVRIALYFLGFVPIFLGIELGFRLWAMPLGPERDAERVRRFNLLTRWWGCSLTWLTRRVLDVDLEVRGAKPDGRFVILANHQSTADIVFLITAFAPLDLKYAAKKSLGRWIPSVSTYLVHGGAALIARTSSREDLAALRDLGRGLERWQGSAVIFAEGTRSEGGELGTFHPAAARVVARESGLPLLPACIEGSHAAKDLPSFARGMVGARVVVTIGAPRPAPANGPAFQEALEDVEAWVARTIDDVRAEAATRPPLGVPELRTSS